MAKQRFNLNIPEELHSRCKEASEKLGIPMSGLINIALNEYLKQNSIIDLTKMFEEFQKQGKI